MKPKNLMTDPYSEMVRSESTDLSTDINRDDILYSLHNGRLPKFDLDFCRSSNFSLWVLNIEMQGIW